MKHENDAAPARTPFVASAAILKIDVLIRARRRRARGAASLRSARRSSFSSRSRETAARLERLLVGARPPRAEPRSRSTAASTSCGARSTTRVQGVESRLVEGQKSLVDHLGASGRILEDVGQKMGRIYEASQKIEKLAGEVTRLEDLLKPPSCAGRSARPSWSRRSARRCRSDPGRCSTAFRTTSSWTPSSRWASGSSRSTASFRSRTTAARARRPRSRSASRLSAISHRT